MVARVGLLITEFPDFSENTLAGKSTMASGSLWKVLLDALTLTLSHGRGRKHLKRQRMLPFCFHLLHRTQRNLNAAVLRFAFRRAVDGDRVCRAHNAGADTVSFKV